PRQQVGQILPVEQLHREKDAATLRGSEVKNVDDAGMSDLGGRPGLAAEAREHVGLARVLRAQNLERDRAPELDVLGCVDGAHPTVPDTSVDLVAPGDDLPLLEFDDLLGALRRWGLFAIPQAGLPF